MEPMSDATSAERILIHHAYERNVPLTGSIELLPLCNMDCEMCYVRLSKSDVEKKGHIRTGKEWFSLAKQMQEAGVVFLLLTGGEPLMHPDFKEIYLGLKKLGMILTVNTNGTLIDEEWADFFQKYPPRRINITIYGASNETYQHLCHFADGFDRCMNGIRLLQKRNIDIRLGVSVTNLNKHDLGKIFSLRKDLNLFTVADTYMCSSTREREREFQYKVRLTPEEAAKYHVWASREMRGEKAFFDHVIRSLERVDNFFPDKSSDKMTCNAGRCSFAVNWLGKINPCVSMSTPSIDAFEFGFTNAWKYLSEEINKIHISSQCVNCKYRSLCCTCAGNALAETGHYDGTSDYLCRYTKEIYLLYKSEVNGLPQ